MRILRMVCIIMLVLSCALPAHAGEGFTSRGIGAGGGLFTPSISDDDPNLMLIATDMGGVYRSENAGRSWEMIHFSQLQRTSGSSAAAYMGDSIYWYSVFTMFESHDRGVTWVEMKRPWPKLSKIAGMVVSRGSENFLFVATANGLWRRDLEDGDWEMVLEGDNRTPVVLGNRIYAASDTALHVSEDAGETWRALYDFSGQVHSLAGGSDGQRTVLVAMVQGKGLLRSEDGGSRWQQVDGHTDKGLVHMTPGQVDVVWAVEQDRAKATGLWRSGDGGKTWETAFRYSGARSNVTLSWVQTDMRWGYFITENGFFVSRTNPNVAILTTQGDMYITRDGGTSWQSAINEPAATVDGARFYRGIGLEVTTCYQYLFDPWEPERHYAAFADIGFIRSLDGGTSWAHSWKGSPWTNSFYRVRFDPEVPGKLYAAVANRHDIPNWSQLGWYNSKYNVGGPIVSDDHGATWRVLGKGFPAAPCTDILVTGSGSERVLYACAYSDGVYKSSDGGATWRDISSNLPKENRNAYRLWRNQQTGALYCMITALRTGTGPVLSGGLWRSDDEGATWRNLTANSPMDWLTAFYVDPDAPDTIYISLASVPARNPQIGGIWKTTDGGSTWERVLKDRGLGGWSFDRMMAVAVHPADKRIVYAGGTLNGLWYSVDAGENWKRYDAFPFSGAQSINFDPRDNTRMVLTTFGAGLWEGPVLPADEMKDMGLR